jgi:hypothetical protein
LLALCLQNHLAREKKKKNQNSKFLIRMPPKQASLFRVGMVAGADPAGLFAPLRSSAREKGITAAVEMFAASASGDGGGSGGDDNDDDDEIEVVGARMPKSSQGAGAAGAALNHSGSSSSSSHGGSGSSGSGSNHSGGHSGRQQKRPAPQQQLQQQGASSSSSSGPKRARAWPGRDAAPAAADEYSVGGFVFGETIVFLFLLHIV